MKTLVVLKPGWEKHPSVVYGIVKFISKNFLKVSLHRTAKPTKKFWKKFYSCFNGTDSFKERVGYMSSSSSVFYIIEGNDIVKLVKDRINEKVHARYGKDDADIANIIHASSTEKNALVEIELVNELFSKE